MGKGERAIRCFCLLSKDTKCLRLLASSCSVRTQSRVFHRFLIGGLDAVPRRTSPGRERRITAAWESELLRVIELDPHEVGQETANWTTERLVAYLGQQTGIQVTEDTVRVYLHAHDYVCKRSTGRSGARQKRRRIIWETPAGRGSFSWYGCTRTSTRS
jgi:transposase